MIDRSFDSLLAGTRDARDHIRESYLSIFVYMPIIMNDHFEKYIGPTLSSLTESISHQNENIRNLSIKTVKTLIHKYGQDKIETILDPLFEGMLADNYVKRNSSTILIGDIIDIMMKEDTSKSKYDIYKEKPRAFCILYLTKNDPIGEVRISATNTWKVFVDNTPKCLKQIFHDLTKCLIELLISGTDYHKEISDIGIKEFIGKYGDMFLTDVLYQINGWKNTNDPILNKGISLYLLKALEYVNPGNLTPIRKQLIEEILNYMLQSDNQYIYESAINTLHIYSAKTGDKKFIEDLILFFSEELNALDEKDEAKMSKEEKDEDARLTTKYTQYFKHLASSNNKPLIKIIERYLFKKPIKYWQLETMADSASVFGPNLYSYGALKNGMDLLLDVYSQQTDREGKDLTKYALTQLVINVSHDNNVNFISEVQTYLRRFNFGDEVDRNPDVL